MYKSHFLTVFCDHLLSVHFPLNLLCILTLSMSSLQQELDKAQRFLSVLKFKIFENL